MTDTAYQTTMPRSGLQHRPINPTKQARNVVTPRSSRPSQVLARRCAPHDEKLIANLTRQRQAPDTDQDTQFASDTRTGYLQFPRWHPRGWHPVVWIIFTLGVVTLAYLASTGGMAWRDTTLIDPGKYGPLHGNVINVVLGGGDNQSQPSKLIAMNNGGRVEIIELLANDPSKAQILPGPNLVTQGFPDPMNAQIELSAGNGSVHVSIYGNYYDAPFHRCQTAYVLVEDGQGNLKQQQQ